MSNPVEPDTADEVIAFIESKNIYMGTIIDTTVLPDNGFIFKVEYPSLYDDRSFEYHNKNWDISILIKEGDKSNTFTFKKDGRRYLDDIPAQEIVHCNSANPLGSGWVYRYFKDQNSALSIWGKWNPAPSKTITDLEAINFATNIALMTTPALSAGIGTFFGIPAREFFDTAAKIINFSASIVNGVFGFEIYYSSYTDTSKQPFQYMKKINATYRVDNNLMHKVITTSENWEYRVLS